MTDPVRLPYALPLPYAHLPDLSPPTRLDRFLCHLDEFIDTDRIPFYSAVGGGLVAAFAAGRLSAKRAAAGR